MSYATLPIVGAFYRPPAQILLNALPIGAQLTLFAEPTNPYDANAIAVWVSISAFTSATLASIEPALADCGLSLDALKEQAEWHLGYLPKEFAAQLKANGTVKDDTPVGVTFATNPAGRPHVRFSAPVL